MIYRNLFRALGNKAVISSLHRLHLLAHFDYIYILRNGSVVDEGTFEQLKRYSLVFKEMWEHQETGQGTASEAAATGGRYPKLNVAF